jgi:hypothetical protein
LKRWIWLVIALVMLAVPASAPAAFPGQNGKIAFSSVQDGDSEIYTINPDGSGLQQLTNNTIADFAPNWSPSGQGIVFLRADGSDYDIWKMNADGSGQGFVHDYPGAPGFTPTYPAWSADGTKIIFGVTDPDNRGLCRADYEDDICGLFMVNPDGTGFQEFAQSLTEACCPSWSPDGSRVVFSTEVFGASGAWNVTVKPIDGPGTNLATGPGTFDINIDPDWSPNQDRIVYTYQSETSSTSFVKVMNPDGTGKVQGHEGRGPVFSPDGTKIAFFSDGPPAGIWIGNAPLGAGATFLTAGGGPAWQPIPINAYPRPKGATPTRVSLVTAYNPCSSPDRTHGPSLAFDSCSGPQRTSAQLTVGSGDANGLPALSEGYFVMRTLPGVPGGIDDSDVALELFVKDVFTSALADYTGELRARVALQITDKLNTPNPGGPGAATTTEIPFNVTASCTPVAAANEGSTCAATTSVDALIPGAAPEGKRAIWQLGKIEVYDGGPDGDADTPAGDTLFATQGVFIP